MAVGSVVRVAVWLLALMAVALFGTLGVMLAVARDAERRGADVLIAAEIAELSDKLAPLPAARRPAEALVLAAQRNAASRLARGQADDGIACATPERDRRFVAARIEPAAAGRDITRTAGANLDWAALDRLAAAGRGGTTSVTLPAGEACNSAVARARAGVLQVEGAQIAVGWTLQPMAPLLLRHGWLALGAVLASLAAGLLIVRALTRRHAAEVRALTAALGQVGEGRFDARATRPGQSADTAALAAAIDTMTVRLRSLTEGLATLSDRIAHDLRTPLARALARVEAARALTIAPGRDPAEASASLDEAARDLDALARRFAAMLALRRLESARSADLQPMDLVAPAAQALDLYRDLDAEDRLRFELDAPEAVPVLADAALLQGALANLVDNAAKASPDGGLIRVVVRALPGGGGIVRVQDDGPGLDAALPGDPFTAGVASAGPLGGHGLGLASVAQAARLHMGGCGLSNRPGGGAEAWLSVAALPG